MPDVIPVIAGLCRVQESSEGRIRNTVVAKGPPGDSGIQVF